MTKKKTNSAITVAEPEVTNSIDMKLSHNDLIDVAIQTNLENLEEEKKAINKTLETLALEYKDFTTKFFKEFEEKGKLEFLKQIKKLNIKCEDIQTANKCRFAEYGNNKDLKVETLGQNITYKFLDLVTLERRCRGKVTLDIFDKETRDRQTYLIIVSNKIHCTCFVETSNLRISSKDLTIEPSQKEHKLFKDNSQMFIDKSVALHNRLWEIDREKLDYTINEKKIKARVLKMSLSKTEEGKNILNLLQSATNVKLLG